MRDVSRKPATKAPAAKKTAAKKTAAKKPAAKQVAARKPAARKPPQSMPYEQGKWAEVFAPRAPGEVRHWLVKSEPDVFSWDDLEAAPNRTTCWDSVRNSGARNFLRDGMQVGDLVFYYHSNATPSAIVGVCCVVRAGYPDHTAFDPSHPYFDPDSDPAHPTWFMVDVQAVARLPRPVPLEAIKAAPALAEMALVRVGRLSVVPVRPAEWETVLAMARG
jgi:predicted RNA-binding protein with PUA-like domain